MGNCIDRFGIRFKCGGKQKLYGSFWSGLHSLKNLPGVAACMCTLHSTDRTLKRCGFNRCKQHEITISDYEYIDYISYS